MIVTFTYNPRSRRYHASSGRFLSARDVRAAVDTIIDKETVKVRTLAQQLVDGSINLAEWQIQTAALIKTLHVAMALAANGGIANSSNASLGYIGSLIKKQYQYLNNMARDIKRGKQLLDGTLVTRAALYTQAARGTFEDVVRRAARNGNVSEEMRILGPSDHCQTCLEQSKLGWQPVGTLRRIGDSLCLSNCHCSFTFR